MLSAKLVAAGAHYTSMLRIPMDKLRASHKPSNMSLLSLMYYGGYATIDSYDMASEVVNLKVPNSSIEKHLADNYLATVFSRAGPATFDSIIQDIGSKIEEVEEMFNTLLSHYTCDALGNEVSIHMIIDTVFKTRFSPTQVWFEYEAMEGRVDAALFSNSRVLVIEYTYNASSAEALKQVHQRQYYSAAAILELKRPVLLLGINLKVSKSKFKSVEIAYELHRDGSG